MNEERPSITIEDQADGKISFLITLTELCWSQIPTSRPNAKQVVSKIISFMEEESKPRKETPIL